ncbi:MAG: class I SAM-dependent methyltransferase [Candidatus Moraniibacteriota bacterium]|jgi:ubiquinone/menaquinone biosynthesis C-methylase UbiE
MFEEEAILKPEKLLGECDIKNDHDVADFGCGPGIFSVPIAQMTEGSVYCFDVLEASLEAVNSRAQIIGLNNIVTKRVNLEKENGSGLETGSVQHVIMRKILLQNDNKEALFTEARRILSMDGNLLVVGWNDDALHGLGAEKKVSREDVLELAKKTGFNNNREIDAGKYHYAFIFTK